MAYGDKDPLKGMDRYDAKLTELGIPHRTRVIRFGTHGFAQTMMFSHKWLDEFVEFLGTI